MSKLIDNFYVDPESGAFQWFNKLLDTHLKEVTNAVFRDGDQSQTDKLRGRFEQLSKLKKALEQVSN